MRKVLTGLMLCVVMTLSSCALFSSGGDVELGTVQTLETHLKNIQKDHMRRLTTEEDKKDIGLSYQAAFDAINSLKKQAGD